MFNKDYFERQLIRKVEAFRNSETDTARAFWMGRLYELITEAEEKEIIKKEQKETLILLLYATIGQKFDFIKEIKDDI